MLVACSRWGDASACVRMTPVVSGCGDVLGMAFSVQGEAVLNLRCTLQHCCYGAVLREAQFDGARDGFGVDLACEVVVERDPRVHLGQRVGAAGVDVYLEAFNPVPSFLQDRHDVDGTASRSGHRYELHRPWTAALAALFGRGIERDRVAAAVGGFELEGVVGATKADRHRGVSK